MTIPYRRQLIYWTTQVCAWGSYAVIIGSWSRLQHNPEPAFTKRMLLMMAVGIGTSHLFRSVVRKHNWLQKNIAFVLPRLALTSVLLGALAFLLHAVLHDALFPGFKPLLRSSWLDQFGVFMNWTLLLSIWVLSYFAYHYFLRQRREEIRNLRLETANRENQLGNLRSQLNPHFMFNALNGIRALIDEDPAKAKQSITQLSAILRNSMMTMRRNTVPLGEELDTVRAYLDLEKMRFEERLRITYDIEAGIEREPVPPMMLQTLAENAVRHGIATLTAGGELIITARREGEGLLLTVRNSGNYAPDAARDPLSGKPLDHGNGIGLRNTRRRLEMLYGHVAELRIRNDNDMVLTEVILPTNTITTNQS